ncbi:MAG TPA: hypothetical protein VJN43_23195 [Bryobacteraceae bacterium]|nr:hypothetical protein [Bryobacteraceae bacterium]
MKALTLIYAATVLPLAAQSVSPVLFTGLPPGTKQNIITQVSESCTQTSPSQCTDSISGDVSSFFAAFGGNTYDGAGNTYTISTDKRSTVGLQSLVKVDPAGKAIVIGTLPQSPGGATGTPACSQNGGTATLDSSWFPLNGSASGMFGGSADPFPYFLEMVPKFPISFNQANNALYLWIGRRIDYYQTADPSFCTTGNGSIVSETDVLALVKISFGD